MACILLIKTFPFSFGCCIASRQVGQPNSLNDCGLAKHGEHFLTISIFVRVAFVVRDKSWLPRGLDSAIDGKGLMGLYPGKIINPNLHVIAFYPYTIFSKRKNTAST